MLLLAPSRKGQPGADLQTVQNPEHALVSYRKCKPDADLQPVQKQKHALVSYGQKGQAR